MSHSDLCRKSVVNARAQFIPVQRSHVHERINRLYREAQQAVAAESVRISICFVVPFDADADSTIKKICIMQLVSRLQVPLMAQGEGDRGCFPCLPTWGRCS